MKKIVLIIIAAMFSFSNAYAVTKCAPTPGGGLCCWDTDVDGPWKPITC